MQNIMSLRTNTLTFLPSSFILYSIIVLILSSMNSLSGGKSSAVNGDEVN